MFIATVFIMVKTWKQPKYPSNDEMDKQNLRFPILKQKETQKPHNALQSKRTMGAHCF